MLSRPLGPGPPEPAQRRPDEDELRQPVEHGPKASACRSSGAHPTRHDRMRCAGTRDAHGDQREAPSGARGRATVRPRRRPGRRRAQPRLHRNPGEHASVGRPPRRGRLHRAAAAAARARQHLAGRPTAPAGRSGTRRSSRPTTRSPRAATSCSPPDCRWAARWSPGWPSRRATRSPGWSWSIPSFGTSNTTEKLAPYISWAVRSRPSHRRRHQEAGRRRAGQRPHAGRRVALRW